MGNVISRTAVVVCCGIAALFGVGLQNRGVAEEPRRSDRIRFNRDIRPILSDNCFQCHGPDQKNRKGELRLDVEADVRRPRAEGALIRLGRPEESELLRRILSTDTDEQMPPPESGKKLTVAQVTLLKQWIAQGAAWEGHWSLIAPQRPDLPVVRHTEQVRNPVDRFILERLDREGLKLSPEADRATLLRRVSLDLTGLPPTPEEVRTFLQDTSADAYERVVDRLLNSPRYGERMAARWLDAARYADTSGYQTDGPRDMWRWRDWVIAAFNHNQPFDQFTTEQLAGDQLPAATREQLIATGFHRNLRGNSEGGIIPEEYLAEYAADRVETTATVWLGLTLMCARCHDHKYDPFTQRDFYQLYAFFNNVPERGRTIKVGNTPPMVKAPTPDQERQLQRTEEHLAAVTQRIESQRPVWEPQLRKWEAGVARVPPVTWMPEDELDWQISFDGRLVLPPPEPAPGPSVIAVGNVPMDPTPQIIPPQNPHYVPGMVAQGIALDGKTPVILGDIGAYDFLKKFSISFWVRFPKSSRGAILSRMKDSFDSPGYSVVLDSQQRLQVNFVARWLDDALKVRTEQPLASETWQHISILYDGTRFASGVRCYVNGKRLPMATLQEELAQAFQATEPLKIGLGITRDGSFQGELDELRSYHKFLSDEEIEILAVPETVSQIASLPQGSRTPAQQRKLEKWFLEHQATADLKSAMAEQRVLRKSLESLQDSIPTVMIMDELPTPKETHVLIRGQYDKPGELVHRNVPAPLPPLPKQDANHLPSRLDLARWLVAPENPLTARVAVNRYWQMYFGQGLVKTVDDFGSQGDWPSHPELLDWLATEFIRTGWNVKEFQKLLVMSATYRQSSRTTPDLLLRDPENRWLGRAPRPRLSSEMIRDSALAVSGLLQERIGGPSVKPYQPEGLWAELGPMEYKMDSGADLYRRTLYTYWKRTVPPPGSMVFDAAGRETCIVRETRTNTPLQALTTMNDVTYMEAARMLARRVLLSSAANDAARVTSLMEWGVCRAPTPAELELLTANLQSQRDYYRTHPDAAQRLLRTGASPQDARLDAVEWCAFTAVSNLVLNLDEFVSRK